MTYDSAKAEQLRDALLMLQPPHHLRALVRDGNYSSVHDLINLIQAIPVDTEQQESHNGFIVTLREYQMVVDQKLTPGLGHKEK